MIELDVQLTADGRLAVVHDFLLRGGSGELRPEAMGFDRLLAAAPGTPLLEDVVAALPARFPLNIELKRDRARLSALVTAVLAFAGRPSTLVSSFDWELLLALRTAAPRLAIAPLAEAKALAYDVQAIADRLDAWSIHVAAALPEPELRELASEHRPIVCYTVNEAPEARRLLSAGVSGVFSDFPGQLRRSLGLSTSPLFH
jgi:glycerophosphoryl diester phosphodiesterase